jgi:GNAT superfamily N-acetyltransferase
MPAKPRATSKRVIVPLTPERWPDLVTLFGAQGACAGCWCMWMRRPAAAFRAGKGAGNRRALRALVQKAPPGLIAYEDGVPVGWVAVAPREAYTRLANSRVLAPVPGEGVWAAPCFYVRAGHRGRGVHTALVAAAAAYAREQGAASLEGYPNANSVARQPAAFVFSGFESVFAEAGFREIARRSPKRPILRRTFNARAAASSRTTKPRVARTRTGGPRG